MLRRDLSLTRDEAHAVLDALSSWDYEYGFAVYPADGVPNGSHGPRTPEEHRAADEKGAELMKRLDSMVKGFEPHDCACQDSFCHGCPESRYCEDSKTFLCSREPGHEGRHRP